MALGLAAQVPGVLADWRLAFLRTGSAAAVAARETALHWDPTASPLLWGWQHLAAGPRLSAVLHLSDYGLPPALDFWVPVGLAGLVVWCAVMLARGLRAPAAAGVPRAAAPEAAGPGPTTPGP